MNRINPHISVDCVVFGFDFEELKVLLIERKFLSLEQDGIMKEDLKLPGDMIRDEEDLDTSAKRVLKELTGLEDLYLQQFHVFDSPNRIKNEKDKKWLEKTANITTDRVVSVAYYSLVRMSAVSKFKLMVTQKAKWVPVNDIGKLAFDHNEIIQKGLQTLRNKLNSEPVAFELLPRKFTINQLHKLYEIILGMEIDNRNFRKKIKTLDYIVPTDEKEKGVAHKPARYYHFDRKKYSAYKKHTMVYSL